MIFNLRTLVDLVDLHHFSRSAFSMTKFRLIRETGSSVKESCNALIFYKLFSNVTPISFALFGLLTKVLAISCPRPFMEESHKCLYFFTKVCFKRQSTFRLRKGSYQTFSVAPSNLLACFFPLQTFWKCFFTTGETWFPKRRTQTPLQSIFPQCSENMTQMCLVCDPFGSDEVRAFPLFKISLPSSTASKIDKVSS